MDRIYNKGKNKLNYIWIVVLLLLGSVLLPTTLAATVGTATFQESTAVIGDTIHADFTWTEAQYHMVGECYATMYIYKPDDSTAASYIEESVYTGSKTLNYVTDAIGTWEAEIKVWDGSSWITDTDTVVVSSAGNVDPTACFSTSISGLTVDVDAGCSTDSDGTITTYQWDWTNDGSYDDSGASATESHTYSSDGSYTIKLRVVDNDGGSDTETHVVTVSGGGGNVDPVACFSVGTSGLTVDVDAGCSSDSDGTITTWQWDWTNDGSYDDTGETDTHTYPSGGTYTIKLRVIDNDGGSDTKTHSVTVSEGGGNVAPTAAFTTSTSGLTVDVDASSSSDSDGTITSYQWDWTNDGSYDTTSASDSASHAYSSADTYTIKLRVVDNGSATDTVTHQVTVSAGGVSSGFSSDYTMWYLIAGVVAAIVIGVVVYLGPVKKKHGRKP